MTNLQKSFFILFITVVYLALNFSQIGAAINLRALDLFRISHQGHPDIVILAIDNKSLQKIGRWPWPHQVHAKIIDKLTESPPATLGIDVNFFEEEGKQSDLQLSTSLSKAAFPVVLSSQIVSTKNSAASRIISPLNQFKNSPGVSEGFTNIPIDEDGLARILPTNAAFSGEVFSPFSFQMARNLNIQIPIKNRYLINFAGGAGNFTTYSVSDFLDGKLQPKQLSNKIILIGSTASDLHDSISAPVKGSIISGVEYNANILDNLLLKRYILLLPKVLTVFLGILTIILYLLAFSYLSPERISWILAVLIMFFPFLSFILWQFGWALFYFSNFALVLLLIIFHGSYNWYISEAEKRKLRQTFQHYFSPQVMEAILKDPSLLKLGGQKREVTILFSDIRNFTSITESMDSEKLTLLLQEYFTAMGREILATDGVIDKFIGDAIMAFWGAPLNQPNHADRALTAAISMTKQLKKLQAKWIKQAFPLIDMGIGINCGMVTVGNMGSEDRFDYTVIGDDVNTASRLEGLNKEFKSHIIISEAIKKKLTGKIKLKSLGSVRVKGKTIPVKIYRV